MDTINLPPYAPILMESTRAIGYSLEAAIADIIDNSIAAQASSVKLNFFPIDGEYVYILDNGLGMDSDNLTRAMQYGSKNPTDVRAENDLGRFGLGLKTASLSQCRKLTVISKCNDLVESRQWDLDFVEETGEWYLKVLSQQEIASLPGYEELQGYKSGTLVLWQDLDRMKIGETNFEVAMGHKMDEVRKHLQLVYHRYLSGEPGIKKLSIYLNGQKLKATDPFLSTQSVRAMDDEILNIYGSKVVVRPYILPHPSKLSLEEIESLGGKEGLRRQQGFYVYRNKRLLIWGTWFRMMRQGELSKLVRICVDIPNALDDLWTLDIKKSSAIPPAEVRNNLKGIIEKMSEKSKRTWTYRGKKETSDSVIHVWNRLMTRNGGFTYEVNREYPLLTELYEKYPGIKSDLNRLLSQIESGLPLNSLYLDLTNDIKVENESIATEREILKSVEEILQGVNESLREAMITTLMATEPFSDYAEEIAITYQGGKNV